jgi:hypothetical protein
VPEPNAGFFFSLTTFSEVADFWVPACLKTAIHAGLAPDKLIILSASS